MSPEQEADNQQPAAEQPPAEPTPQTEAEAEQEAAPPAEPEVDFAKLTPGQQAAERMMATVENLPARDWDKDLDSYPLREKSKDPRWAIRIVWTWVGVVLVFIAFILWLIVAGWTCVPR